MSYRRFTVERRCVSVMRRGAAPAWVVLDRGERITIGFSDYAEAERHRDAIHALYLRWGW